jgi:hypothetical protein
MVEPGQLGMESEREKDGYARRPRPEHGMIIRCLRIDATPPGVRP